MKRLILTCISVAAFCAAQAQMSLNKSDLAVPGDTIYYASDTVNITVDMSATAGASQTWDFSSAPNHALAPAWFLLPENSPIPAPSNITHVLIDGDETNVTFLNATDTALYNIQANPAYSFVGGEPFLGVKSLGFPLHYQDESKDSILSTSVIGASAIGLGSIADSVRITIQVKVYSLCDAWGSLKTARTTYDSTLRIKNTIQTFFKFEGKRNIMPIWVEIPVSMLPLPIPAEQTEITYAWLGRNSGYFLAEVNMNTDSETERDVFRWQTNKPDVSNGLLSTVKNNMAVGAFPNPASSQVNVRFALNNAALITVNVYDVTGKLIKNSTEKCAAGTNTIALSTDEFSNGLYTVTVSGNGKSASIKVSVAK